MTSLVNTTFEDPIFWLSRAVNKLHSLWMSQTYPFATLGRTASFHWSCNIRRSVAKWIEIGNCVQLRKDVWINIPDTPSTNDPIIKLEDHCKIGARSVISAKNGVYIGHSTILAPSALIMDHNHEFTDPTVPIGEQGTSEGGRVYVEEGCWIGFGAAIVCGQGTLVVGRNSVIGANSVLTRSVPPYSIVSGNPGRVVKHYDHQSQQWKVGGAPSLNAVGCEAPAS